ncbi:helix-turn-helix domain-containing protein [Paracoccus litorisediminis]|uniref:helix-turn-helix domain-containing protein n=1 Tax=Paracoccus litorisediminis TaxID=2006130 RepID=UPI00373022C1
MAFKAELLRKKLKESGKTRAFLSDVTDRTERTVSRWLNNGPRPKDKDLEKIARALGCDPREFDPSFAPEGLGSVAVHAQVSVAAHNAFAMLNFRYGVSQREIIEVAPILFSIVAAYGMGIPEDDDALAVEAHRRGLASPLNDLENPVHGGVSVSEMDARAVRKNRCFGLPATSAMAPPSRHLFHEAIMRLSGKTGKRVDARNFVLPESGEAPTAVGFIPDVELFHNMTKDDAKLQDGLMKGQIHLSPILGDWKSGRFSNGDEFRKALYSSLDKERDAYRQPLAEQREIGLAQLKAWRAFYGERHPDLAREYDQIVDVHCHEDGWYPIDYAEEDKAKFWTKPYLEERFINEATLPDLQRRRESGHHARVDSEPICLNFQKLRRHRDEIRLEFNPGDLDLRFVVKFPPITFVDPRKMTQVQEAGE